MVPILKEKHQTTLPICICGHEALKAYKDEIVQIRYLGCGSHMVASLLVSEQGCLAYEYYDYKGMKVAAVE